MHAHLQALRQAAINQYNVLRLSAGHAPGNDYSDSLSRGSSALLAVQLQGLQAQLAAARVLSTSVTLPRAPQTEAWSQLTANEARDAALTQHVTSTMDPSLYLTVKETIISEFWSSFHHLYAFHNYGSRISNPIADRNHSLHFYRVIPIKKERAHPRSYRTSYYISEWKTIWLLPKLPESLQRFVLDNAFLLQYDLGNLGYLLEISHGQLEYEDGINSMNLSFGK